MRSDRKILSLIFLACGAIAWMILRELFESIWVVAKLPSPAGWVLSPSEMLAVLSGAAVFIIMYTNSKVTEFTGEVIAELSRVVWPNRKETALSTVVVTVLVMICAMILFGFDMLWGALVKIFYQ
ncbi:MAG TPA: preprotein translocase subunit SecE [bacterium]|nr:preprotein translocase subunit SecE [Myxococcales bacterium]OQA60810.1 MAG: preprotein translocase subunit SecE [bacterium ADurb.Bin270]HPW45393.1 preprotein translocase subunit SecE [bacterium]HQC51110.1 preprotein translocase subunit SecE [bacterium]